MDLSDPEEFAKYFANEELQQIPLDLQNKLKSYVNAVYDKYCIEKASSNLLVEYQQRIEDLQSKEQDDKNKLDKYDQNVRELREQLESLSTERNGLRSKISAMDKELSDMRLERIRITDERDSLLKMMECQKMQQDRLQEELQQAQEQLSKAINAKCDVIVRLEEIESKEKLLDMKEKRFEQERELLQEQVKTLNVDLTRNTNEMQSVRRDFMVRQMHLDTQLNEKKEALKISLLQNEENERVIEQLNQQLTELNDKLLKQRDETCTVIDIYKRECASKERLAEIYKSENEDSVIKCNELTTCIAELKRLLTEQTEQYGELETELKATKLQHEQELDEKQKQMDELAKELKLANELIESVKQESTDNAIARLAPTAAIASRLLRTDMSLTEVYSMYVKSSEDLSAAKHENNRLKLEIRKIISEVSERAPLMEKRSMEYEKLLETHNIVLHQRDQLLIEKAEMQEYQDNLKKQIKISEQEKRLLKQSQADVCRQITYLLQHNEEQAGNENNATNDAANNASLSNSKAVINKKLVTFSNISELQTRNVQLLSLVRSLSEKLEKTENENKGIDVKEIKTKLENSQARVNNMQETLNRQNHIVATLMDKTERYKKMYFDLHAKLKLESDSKHIELDEMETSMMSSDDVASKDDLEQKNVKAATNGLSNRKLAALEQELQVAKDNYRALKEQYDYYVQEKKKNDKLFTEQFDAMRTEVRELQSSNCKLGSQNEHLQDQLKLQQKNIQTYKKQINALENCNKNYDQAVIKHEHTIVILRDDLLKLQKDCEIQSTELSNLKHENRLLHDSINRLQTERELYYRQQQSDNLLLSSIEQIKCNLERNELVGRQRLEQNLNDTIRELGATRRRMEEEEQRFNDLSKELRKETELAAQRAQEQQQQTESVRIELEKAREELNAKSAKIDELSKKLQESLTPCLRDNPVTKANRKIRELTHQLSEAQEEITALKNNLKTTNEHATHYAKQAELAEQEICKLNEINTEFMNSKLTELSALQEREKQLKARIEELETESRLMSLTDVTKKDENDKTLKLQNELKESIQKLSESNGKLREENTRLMMAEQTLELKFANEKQQHASSVHELSTLKAEYAKFANQISELKKERDIAIATNNESKQSHENIQQMLMKEKEQMEQNVIDLNQHISSLHNQIDALTCKLSILSQQQPAQSTNSSLNDSSANVSLNESNMSDSNQEQLVAINKFLRKEKDLYMARLETTKAENARLQAERNIAQQKVAELQQLIDQERSKSESTLGTATQHHEMLRKIDQINALMDSNRILREERNMATNKVNDLMERINSMEEQFYPLRAQCNELTIKVDTLTADNKILKDEAGKWRVRANQLVEKSQKNPEEFKRLQMERENLAKMFTAEQEKVKRLNEELDAAKVEKLRLENVIAANERQLHSLQEERKKLNDEIAALRQNQARLSQEMVELKTRILEKDEMLLKLKEDFDAKEAQLQDSKNKEVQIRKIAKRYKDSYLELTNKRTDAIAGNSSGLQDNADIAGANESGTSAALAASASEELEQLKSAIEARDKSMQELEEQKEQMRQKYEDLQATVEMDDHTKSLLREAKIRIVSLNDENTAKNEELKATKNNMEALKQSIETQESNFAALKAEAKELREQNNLGKEAIARMTREIESLQMRITQLNRQLGLQQSAKPTTSSVAITDKSSNTESSPRTANVKPMSGASSMQQSATVTPWRGSETTPLASIRPLSVQNSRTAAILPTSQQPTVGAGTSSSSSSTSSSNATSTPSSGSCSNTALVPPQQVHTTGNSSIESITSSPTSSHTDYMPSTSSAAVVVAAIPPMGSASAAESSQEAESVQQPQAVTESQLLLGAGAQQQQVVALVSPRVEASSQNISSPNMHMQQQQQQQQQDALNQLPSTSGSSSSSSHVAVSSHNRHTPSSSNVTTTQAASSVHKRPRDADSDSFTNDEDCTSEKPTLKHAKRLCVTTHSAGDSTLDSGADVEYQVPTSSQRDQEDDIVVVDSDEDEEEEEEDGMVEADDGPMTVDLENEAYEDSYEPDHNVDDGISAEESVLQADAEADNNEVEMSEHEDVVAAAVDYADGASTSQAAAAAAAAAVATQQQSQTISSGTAEAALPQRKQPGVPPFGRQQKAAVAAHMLITEADAAVLESTEGETATGSSEIVSSPQAVDAAADKADAVDTGAGTAANSADMESAKAKEKESSTSSSSSGVSGQTAEQKAAIVAAIEEAVNKNMVETLDLEGQPRGSAAATQSEIEDVQQSQVVEASEDNEGADGVSSEGEKPTHEDIEEEEGREAEATTTPSTNTRTTRSAKSVGNTPSHQRRPTRAHFQRGSRPTPIVWQDSPGNSRNHGNLRGHDQQQQQMQQSGNASRGNFSARGQRGRRMRRPTGASNFSNMRFP